MSETVLKQQERIAFALRGLYRQYGYLPYKMSKFEPYDLYASNKEFLTSEGIITFNDTDGKLLALKPDVTMSIIKNAAQGVKRKVYYHENVYRISGETKQFKEIPQVGVECMGDLDAYDLFETVKLAAESLNAISSNFALDVAHLGILSALLEELALGETFNQAVVEKISQKNLHELEEQCVRFGVSEKKAQSLLQLVRTYGDMQTVLLQIAPYCKTERAKKAYDELQTLCSLLKTLPYADKIRFDFSVVNDMHYYNGFVFKGFVDGVCESVLSGGEYGGLMAKMGKNTDAIGFAVYLDLLEGFNQEKNAFDVDILLLYDDNADLQKLADTVQKWIALGNSVCAQKNENGVRYAKLIKLAEVDND